MIIERASMGYSYKPSDWNWLVWDIANRPSHFCRDCVSLQQFLRSELNMKYTHLLELSATEPRQYRITVVEDRAVAIIDAQINMNTEGFNLVGWYDTPEELLAVLIPYLQMEGGK